VERLAGVAEGGERLGGEGAIEVVEEVALIGAVELVAHEGAALEGEVGADLVLAPRAGLGAHEAAPRRPRRRAHPQAAPP